MEFPIKNGGSFHSYVKVYQRVSRCVQIRWESLGFSPTNIHQPCTARIDSSHRCDRLGTRPSAAKWFWRGDAPSVGSGMGGFQSGDAPIAGWFTMENPMKILWRWMIWGYISTHQRLAWIHLIIKTWWFWAALVHRGQCRSRSRF